MSSQITEFEIFEKINFLFFWGEGLVGSFSMFSATHQNAFKASIFDLLRGKNKNVLEQDEGQGKGLVRDR